MLTTDELILKKDSILFPYSAGRAAKAAYKNKLAEFEREWAEWLAEGYNYNLSVDIHKIIYAKAWADGHASGYEEVEKLYREQAEFALNVVITSRK